MPWQRRDADSLAVHLSAQHGADGKFLTAAVEQVSEAQRFAARQLQASQAQGALSTGHDQTVLAGAEYRTGLAFAFGDLSGKHFQRFAVEGAVADRPRVEGANQTFQFIRRA